MFFHFNYMTNNYKNKRDVSEMKENLKFTQK